MSQVVNKKCEKCQKDFPAKNYWQRFCSSGCRLAKWQADNPRIAKAKLDALVALEAQNGER